MNGRMTRPRLSSALLRDLAAAGLSGTPAGPRRVPALPREVGAYALLLRLRRPQSIATAKDATVLLGLGWYVYAGSAYGPGGIAARVARHFRASKRRHWHIDRLTEAAELWAFGVPGGRECALVSALLASGAFAVPLPGFGSSDCRRCPSHLLAWHGKRRPSA